MMKLKDKIITCIFCTLILGLYLILGNYDTNKDISKVYNVYLDGKMIGAIKDKDALYDLIDEKQQAIKEKYNVSKVYPPSSLEIIENYSYNTEILTVENIYNKIEQIQDFTIKGYEVKVSGTDEHDAFSIYLLDKNIFKDAVLDFVLAFINEEGYTNYMNGTQKVLDDIGITYDDLKIIEDISIREKYISVNDKIYESSEELAQELLFGFNYEEQKYTVKEGDTISSISDKFTLNTQEFLIANPRYTSKDSMLTIGEKVNVTLINPEISFSYKINEMKEKEYDFNKIIERDDSMPSNFSEITQQGVKGISIETSHYTVVNGEPSTEVEIDPNPIVIRATVDQITTKGKKATSYYGNQTFDDTGTGWLWPTISPFYVTSEFAPRWGKRHNGMDISTGRGTNIFAASDGVVTHVTTGCPNEGYYGSSCGGGYGNYVVIDHGDNIYTLYGHMLNNITVRVGQVVKRGDVIGHLGNSGSSKGYHLHFGLSIGDPTKGGTFRDPWELWR